MQNVVLEKLNENSMQIILHAGDARLMVEQAFKSFKEKDAVNFYKVLDEANEKIVEAHRIQTRCIQDQIELEENIYSILFSHAQDTLMTVKTEYELTKKFGSFLLEEEE